MFDRAASRCLHCCTETSLNLFWKYTFHCDKHVPGFDVSSHSSNDQERWGGRRLLQEMDNGSLEELESEGSKNCTAPGKTETRWKKEDKCSFPPSLHLSLPPYIQNSAGDEKKKSETNDHPTCSVFLPPHPPVFTAWCGVTQIVRSGDFPWARAIAGGDILAVSAVFTVVLCHVFLGSCRFSPHSLPPIPLLTLSSSLPSPSSVFPSCFSPIVARSQGKKKNPCFHGDLLSYHQPATSVWSAQGQHVRMLETSCLESSKSLSPNKRGEIRHV